MTKQTNIYTIDTEANKDYFLIFKDGILYLKISKKNNDIETLKRYFNIKD